MCVSPRLSSYNLYSPLTIDQISGVRAININFHSVAANLRITRQNIAYYQNGQVDTVSSGLISVSYTSRYNREKDSEKFSSSFALDQDGNLNMDFTYSGFSWKKSCPRFDIEIALPEAAFESINVNSNIAWIEIDGSVAAQTINVTSSAGYTSISQTRALNIIAKVNAIGFVDVRQNEHAQSIDIAIPIGKIVVDANPSTRTIKTNNIIGATRIFASSDYAGSVDLSTDMGITFVRGFDSSSILYLNEDGTPVASQPEQGNYGNNNDNAKNDNEGNGAAGEGGIVVQPAPGAEQGEDDGHSKGERHRHHHNHDHQHHKHHQSHKFQQQPGSDYYPESGHQFSKKHFSKKTLAVLNGGSENNIEARSMVGCVKVISLPPPIPPQNSENSQETGYPQEIPL